MHLSDSKKYGQKIHCYFGDKNKIQASLHSLVSRNGKTWRFKKIVE